MTGSIRIAALCAALSKGSSRSIAKLAGFFHAALGYRWALPWSPRVSLDYDYASGDMHPGDGTDNRFDTLYGARRFDFGPTGIYGAVARSNIDSPGLRLALAPDKRTGLMAGYPPVVAGQRPRCLDHGGLQDTSGGAGNWLGQQFEARLRYAAVPGTLDLEAGGAVLLKGDFQRHIAGAPPSGTSTYGYLAATFRF